MTILANVRIKHYRKLLGYDGERQYSTVQPYVCLRENDHLLVCRARQNCTDTINRSFYDVACKRIFGTRVRRVGKNQWFHGRCSQHAHSRSMQLRSPNRRMVVVYVQRIVASES